jgi:glycosyltransferase involved in cell wall biosynthesis
MRILFLSHYFPPEINAPATRTFEYCKQWVEHGHEVTVISCTPHHPMGKVYPGYKNKFYQVEEKDGIKAIKVLTYVTAKSGFLKRTWNYVFYMLMVIFIAPFIAKADVVISTSPQFFNGLAGYFVSRIKRCPWVLEIRDLWPESILAVGAIKNKSAIKLLEWLEKFVYRKADHIIPVTFAFKRHIEKHGGDANKITVIRNGVSFDLFKLQQRNNEFARSVGVDGKFVVSYVGTHGLAHGLSVILDAAEKLKHKPEIIFLMIGDGAEKKKLLEEKSRRQLDNVIMLDQQPKQEMPNIWSISDVSLVLLKKQNLFLTVIPSKIFETMAMKKPIVLGVRGESQALIEEGNAGICIEPENVDELVTAVVKLYEDADAYHQYAENGYVYVQQHFDRKKLANQYETILMSLVK